MSYYTHRPYRSMRTGRVHRERDEGQGDGTRTAHLVGKCVDTGATYRPGDRIQSDGKGGWKLVWQAPANRNPR